MQHSALPPLPSFAVTAISELELLGLIADWLEGCDPTPQLVVDWWRHRRLGPIWGSAIVADRQRREQDIKPSFFASVVTPQRNTSHINVGIVPQPLPTTSSFFLPFSDPSSTPYTGPFFLTLSDPVQTL